MQSKRSYILFIIVCAIFGNTFLAISLAIQSGAPPLFLAAIRFTTAGSLMVAGLFLCRKATLDSLRPLLGRSLILSLLMTVGTFGCMFIAQKRVDSGFMARLDATGPLVTAFLVSIFLRKKITSIHYLAFLLATAGSFLIAVPGMSAETPYLLCAMGSVIFYALANAIYPVLFRPGEDPVLISAMQALWGGIILLALALVFEPVKLPREALGPLIYLVIGGSIIGHTATLVLVRDAGPVFASGWLYVAPAVATVSGFLVLGENITPAGVGGTVLALIGVFVLDRAEAKQLVKSRES